jgi:hypothetical protein
MELLNNQNTQINIPTYLAELLNDNASERSQDDIKLEIYLRAYQVILMTQKVVKIKVPISSTSYELADDTFLNRSYYERYIGKSVNILRAFSDGSRRLIGGREFAENRKPWPQFSLSNYIGSKSILYNEADVYNSLNNTKHFINSQVEINRNRIAVIVGNGPSLKKTDFTPLQEESVDVFISNFAVKSDELRSICDYVAITNHLVIEQGREYFSSLEGKKLLTPFWLNYCVGGNDAYFFNALGGESFFSPKSDDYVSWHSTVTYFLMQICYSLGYKKVLLIGVDNTYIQPKNSKEGDSIKQTEDDDNHFISNYFKGLNWQAADTSNMEKMYKLAQAEYNNSGKEIVNCTVGGALEIFRRSTLTNEI